MSGGVKVSDSQKAAARTAFDSFDKKGDGVKVGDIPSAMKSMGQAIKGDFLESIEDQIDTEGRGVIDFDEFCLVLQLKLQGDEDERELKEIFRILDKDRKGEISTDIVRDILRELSEVDPSNKVSEEEIEDMIADVDTDGSGWVDYDEFAKLMS